MALVSQRAYARRRGISQAAVQKRTAAAGGPIPTHGPKKLIDVAEADALWEGTQTPQGAGGAENGRRAAAPSPLTQARAAAVVLDVRLRQLQLDQRRGELISRSRAQLTAFNFARTVRDAWLSWPTRVGPALAAELGVEPAVVVVALDEAVRAHLEELASERVEF